MAEASFVASVAGVSPCTPDAEHRDLLPHLPMMHMETPVASKPPRRTACDWLHNTGSLLFQWINMTCFMDERYERPPTGGFTGGWLCDVNHVGAEDFL